MTINSPNSIPDEVRAFLAAVSKAKPYQMILRGEGPMEAEIRLYMALKKSVLIIEQEVNDVRSWLLFEQAYFLVNFARRMAVFAARTNDVDILIRCTIGFVFDDSLVEWRDILIDLSIVEDCAIRLGTDLVTAMEGSLRFASDKRRDTIVGYYSRPQEMRGLEVMRVAVSGSGSELTYTRIPWA
jgi:hypothetical protein